MSRSSVATSSRFSISISRLARSAAFMVPLACLVSLSSARLTATDDLNVTPMHVAKMAAMRLLYSEQKTTFTKMQGGMLNPAIDKVRAAAGDNVTGPLVFSYVGMSQDMNAEFTLKIGLPVKPGTAAPEGFMVADVPEYKCATLVLNGPMANMGKAYETLYGELMQQGLVPTGDSREFYLYWEGPMSENDVTLLQVGVK